MKKHNLILIVFLFLIGFLFSFQANAKLLKNPFKKNNSQPSATNHKSEAGSLPPDTTLKARAAYLELEGDSVEYDHDSNVYITSGMSVAHIVDQDAILEANEIIYYGSDQHIEAVGNIKITRSNVVTRGESFKFDAASDKYLLTKPETVLQGAIIRARKADGLPQGTVEYERGRLRLDEPIRIAQGFGTRRNRPHTFYSYQSAQAATIKPTWGDILQPAKYKVTAEKIIYNHTKAINNLTVYGARVHFQNFSLPLLPKFTTTVTSDPNVRTAPLIAPTIGTQGALGGFALGPAFNFNLNDYHILSLSPFGQLGTEGKGGFGGMIGFYGPDTTAEFLYGSLKSRFVGKIVQRIFNHTQFRAAYNQYLDDGFLGQSLAHTVVELVDRRSISNIPFTEDGISFRSAVNWSETQSSILPSKYKEFLKDAGDPKDFKNSAYKLEEQVSLVSKPLFKLGSDKYNTALRFRTRNAFRVYSTGDFQGIFTGGPLLDNTVGPAMFELGYDQGYVKGKSPLFYDQYIQGMQSIALDGDVRLHEWITLGGYGTYNIKTDELVERQVRAKIGPKDFKMLVNWDVLRQQTQFGLNFLFGQPVDFEKFVIINSQAMSGGI